MLLGITFLIGCQEIGQPVPYCYTFSIVDSVGVNLVGDKINLNRFTLDSIKFYPVHGLMPTRPPFYSFINGYVYGVCNKTNSNHIFNDIFIIRYNSLPQENDTINVNYSEANVSINRNNQLIFTKNNISQTTDIFFKIIK